jgi:hypothetical protein
MLYEIDVQLFSHSYNVIGTFLAQFVEESNAVVCAGQRKLLAYKNQTTTNATLIFLTVLRKKGSQKLTFIK